MLAPVSLFHSHKERLVAFACLLVLFGANLALEFFHYERFFSHKKRFTSARVLAQYPKGSYTVLKLRSEDGVAFYTSTKEPIKDLRTRRVEVLLFRPRRVPSFWKFLRGFYIPSYILRLYPADTLREILFRKIAIQHSKPFFRDLFGALYLAVPLTKEERAHINLYGIAHLVAISGFHLGLLAAVVTFVFAWGMRWFWQRMWPHANIYFYAGLLSIAFAFGYLVLLGPLPALLRSFAMMVVGFFLGFRHVRLLSFETLFWVVAVLVALFPKLLFSIGFLLSVAGVFYIYLFVHIFRFSGIVSLVALNLWLFVTMLPFSLHFFHQWSPLQLFAPLLSLLFVLFYPLSIILHLAGFGGVLDGALHFLLREPAFTRVEFPSWLLGVYVLLSLLAIRKRIFVAVVIAIVVIFLIYHVA